VADTDDVSPRVRRLARLIEVAATSLRAEGRDRWARWLERDATLIRRVNPDDS
jgi:hypothetical protein